MTITVICWVGPKGNRDYSAFANEEGCEEFAALLEWLDTIETEITITHGCEVGWTFKHDKDEALCKLLYDVNVEEYEFHRDYDDFDYEDFQSQMEAWDREDEWAQEDATFPNLEYHSQRDKKLERNRKNALWAASSRSDKANSLRIGIARKRAGRVTVGANRAGFSR